MVKHKSSGRMGFRNFRDFNVSMLGKQGWRIITNPNTLVSRLYKARYFVDTDFLNASRGHNPSFIWRSILEARDLLKEGIRWRVGSGETILIRDQPWLLLEDNPYITINHQALENKTVASLLRTDMKKWDVDIVKDIFNDRDQRCILIIPLVADNNADTMYWRHEITGIYSVKSAYKHLQMQKGVWSVEDKDSLWSLLWQIKAPPKALNLVWRALANCLPTLVNYNINSDNIIYETAMDFAEWLNHVLKVSSKDHSAEKVTLYWAIWRARNEFPNIEGDGASTWIKPHTNTVKVSVDAAIFQERQETGVGLIARDSTGSLLQTKAVIHTGQFAPILPEAMAIKEALSWIDEMHLGSTIIESDCLVASQAIRYLSRRQNSIMSNYRLPSPMAANLINNFDEAYDDPHVEEQLLDEDLSRRQNFNMSNSRLLSPVASNLINNFDEAYDGTNVEEQIFDEEAEYVDFPGIDLWES
ncbi:uncharacterized protein LOC141719122 [Apium graveolens]|uniref:uncharacterized protein LOC141719122 n=1 Tax=Apium graveolens TaxID=4045 RepID=UPI003D7BECD7